MAKIKVKCGVCPDYNVTREAEDGADFIRILRKESLCSTIKVNGQDMIFCPKCGSKRLSWRVVG